MPFFCEALYRKRLGLLLIVILWAGFHRTDFAQNNRINSLGGLRLTLRDKDNGSDLFNFGSNPAYFCHADTLEWLEISPFSGNSWGNYKRKFDPEGEHDYNLASKWSRTLDKNNKFLGKVSYNYIRRANVFGVLEYEPYSGKSYFMADTSSENVTYNGPAVGFIYSFNIYKKLLGGIDCDYQILDGQRNGYSHTITLFRKISAKFGLAYEISDNIIIGSTCGVIDSQEEMDSQNDGSDIVVTFYKGDQTSFREIFQDHSVKEREKGKTISLQGQYKGEENWEMALKGNYSSFNKTLLLPKGPLLEDHTGYTYLEHYDFQWIARCYPAQNLTLGFSAGYEASYSWTKMAIAAPDMNLKWLWNTEQKFGALGVSYYFENIRLLLGTEYKISQISADSSKYIDHVFFNDKSNEHELKAGAELEAIHNIFFRFGFNYSTSGIDLKFGGLKMKQNIITSGIGIKILSGEIDIILRYGKLILQERAGSDRSIFDFAATYKLLTF